MAYELTKLKQNTERKNGGELIVVEQKEILKSLDPKCKVHLNPKSSTVFIDFDYLHKDQDYSDLLFTKQDPLILEDHFFYKVDQPIPEEKCKPKKNNQENQKRKTKEKNQKVDKFSKSEKPTKKSQNTSKTQKSHQKKHKTTFWISNTKEFPKSKQFK